ncbi:MAG: nucleoside-diphosphate kinase, partial [Planctomycetia bacterium]
MLMERTFVMFKPDCLERGLLGRMVSRFEEKGLRLVAMKM